MLYNKYKNRIKLIFDLIFNFKEFIIIKNKYEEEIINKETIKLKKEFEKKLNFLKYDYLKKGIARRSFERPILKIPIFDYNINPFSSLETTYDLKVKTKQIYKVHFSYSNTNIPLEQIQKEIIFTIAKYLIENDFVNAHFTDKDILFTINIFV